MDDAFFRLAHTALCVFSSIPGVYIILQMGHVVKSNPFWPKSKNVWMAVPFCFPLRPTLLPRRTLSVFGVLLQMSFFLIFMLVANDRRFVCFRLFLRSSSTNVQIPVALRLNSLLMCDSFSSFPSTLPSVPASSSEKSSSSENANRWRRRFAYPPPPYLNWKMTYQFFTSVGYFLYLHKKQGDTPQKYHVIIVILFFRST